MSIAPNVLIPAISREEADAIEVLRSKIGESSTQSFVYKVLNANDYEGRDYDILRSIPFDTLLAALVNGWTVEKTPEEAAHEYVRNWYESLAKVAANPADTAWQMAQIRMWTIEDVLRIVNVKIEGVNV
ncbi:hypothetical protein [Paenibacillus agricola]|uniref:Uncharacterized protein n=1 Tax=Paenibacillus agricola TaxID=2716264 RepID=A0ABX0J719_9BACL|nr:hypothetical protein [Paenibacillus agricola]NHN31195.1 hypothetical protein [Paenibacillus agricola]